MVHLLYAENQLPVAFGNIFIAKNAATMPEVKNLDSFATLRTGRLTMVVIILSLSGYVADLEAAQDGAAWTDQMFRRCDTDVDRK